MRHMAKEKKLVILSVRVDDALAAAVKQLADADSRPVSNYIEVLLRKHVTELGVDLGPVHRGEPLITARVGAASPGVGIGELGAVAAIVVGGIAAHLAVERTPVAAEQPGDGRHGNLMLAEPGQGISFGSGDLGVHR